MLLNLSLIFSDFLKLRRTRCQDAALKFFKLPILSFCDFVFSKIRARDELKPTRGQPSSEKSMRAKKKRLSSRKLLCWNMRDVLAFATVVGALLFITARARAQKMNYEIEVRARMSRVNMADSSSVANYFHDTRFFFQDKNKSSLLVIKPIENYKK